MSAVKQQRKNRSWIGCSCILISICLSFFAIHPVSRAADFAAAQRADRLVITRDENPVAHFVFADTNILRPYFAHVHTPDGIPVTRTHPPVPGVDPADHATMHPGIWLAFGDISGQDFWRNKATIRHDRFTKTPAARGRRLNFATESSLVANNGNVLAELRSYYTFASVPDGYLLICKVSFIPVTDDFAFNDQEEMGFGVRVATPISEKNGGLVRNSEGLIGAKTAWGKTADWCDYSGVLGHRLVGIAVLADSSNFRPSWFHCRDYGLVVANPFGRKAFTKGEPSRVPVKKGANFHLRFAAYVHSTPKDELPDIAAASKTFANKQ